MKTLHNIFHNKLLKNYFLIFLTSVISLVIWLSTAIMKNDSSFIVLVSAIALLISTIGPLAIFFINTNFPFNIKFLINQHFNRSELIKFFFLSQTLKIILCFFNYCTLGLIMYLISGKTDNIFSISKLNFLYSNYFAYLLLIASIIYFIYFFSLFNVNMPDLQRSKVVQSTLKVDKKKQYLYIFMILSLISILSKYTIPDALKGYLWCLFIVFSFIKLFDRTFKLYNPKKSFNIAINASFILCLPLVGILYGMHKESHDSSISYKERAESVAILDWLNTEFSQQQMLGFLEKTGDENYNKILNMFGNKLEFDSSLSSVNNKYRAKKFIDFHSKENSQIRIEKIVNHMSVLMKNEKLNFSFAQYSHSFFKKQKVEISYIKKLVNSDSKYKQLAAIYFAKNSLKKDQFIDFYKKNLSLLDKVVINDEYVSRSIASEKSDSN
jgi:hypothetical protein